MRHDVLSLFQQVAHPRAMSLLQSLTSFDAEKHHPRHYLSALLTSYDQGAVEVLKKKKNLSPATKACLTAFEQTHRALLTLREGDGETFLAAFTKIVEQKRESASLFINGAIGLLLRERAPDGRCYAAEQALALTVLADHHAGEGLGHDDDCPEFSRHRDIAAGIYHDTAVLCGDIATRGIAAPKQPMPHH